MSHIPNSAMPHAAPHEHEQGAGEPTAAPNEATAAAVPSDGSPGTTVVDAPAPHHEPADVDAAPVATVRVSPHREPPRGLPWLAIAAGGVLALGTAVGAAAALRSGPKPAPRRAAKTKPRRRRAQKKRD